MNVRPFRIDVPGSVLDDLRARLDRTRWPDTLGNGWDAGTEPSFLRRLVDHWRTGFDWRSPEAELNRLPQFRTESGLHFAHVRSGSGFPMLLLHGWPSTFAQMTRLVPRLADPAAHGGDAADALDVVVPSLPGFGFSGAAPGTNIAAMAEELHTLMTGTLGYERYAVRGSDFGLAIALYLGAAHPEHVAAVHIGGTHLEVGDVPGDLTGAEREFVAASRRWYAEEGGYVAIQSTKPQTLGYALNDSPAGLAAWITEKFRTWCARPDDPLSVFGPDDLLTVVTLYWVTETITSSMRLYREERLAPTMLDPVRVPLAVNQPELEEFVTPTAWWRRIQPVTRYTVLPGAAHFPEWEAPDALAGDLWAYLRPIRAAIRS